jgi:hypothetical protein
MLTREQKSEINRAANRIASNLAKEIASQAILMKELGDTIEFELRIIWNDADKSFHSSYVDSHEDKL